MIRFIAYSFMISTLSTAIITFLWSVFWYLLLLKILYISITNDTSLASYVFKLLIIITPFVPIFIILNFAYELFIKGHKKPLIGLFSFAIPMSILAVMIFHPIKKYFLSDLVSFIFLNSNDNNWIYIFGSGLLLLFSRSFKKLNISLLNKFHEEYIERK